MQKVFGYVDRCNPDKAYLIIFDRTTGKSWEEKIFEEERMYSGTEHHPTWFHGMKEVRRRVMVIFPEVCFSEYSIFFSLVLWYTIKIENIHIETKSIIMPAL